VVPRGRIEREGTMEFRGDGWRGREWPELAGI
jgi:hypothetical protein